MTDVPRTMRTKPDDSTARLHSHLIAATLLFALSLALFWPGYPEFDTLRQY